MQFLNSNLKEHYLLLKNLKLMYRADQNRLKRSFVLIFLNILMQFIELNNDFEYFIHVGRLLKRGVKGGGSPPHKCFNFNI